MTLHSICFADGGLLGTAEEGAYYDGTLANDCVFFSVSGGQVTGCVALSMDEAPTATLSGLAISPAWRRQGHARALLRHCRDLALEAHCAAVVLTVDVDNASAVSLYSDEGYVAQGVPFLDTDGAMAMTMRHDLASDSACSDSGFLPFCTERGTNLVRRQDFLCGAVVFSPRDERALACRERNGSPQQGPSRVRHDLSAPLDDVGSAPGAASLPAQR